MATKILRVPSNQSGPFTVSNNKVDITIPEYMSYIDASQTCLILNLKMKNTAADAINAELYDGAFNDGLDARCLFKTVSIYSSKNGVLEQIPALNVLKANIEQTQRDFEDENSSLYMGYQSTPDYNAAASVSSLNDPTTNRIGVFVQKRRDGSAYSQQETYLKVPLSSIFGICNMKQFPVNLFGDVKISLEFEDDQNIIKHLFKYTAHRDIDIPDSAFATGTISSVSLPYGDSYPLYVGEPISITADGTADTTDERVITSINYNSTNNTVDVSWNNSIALDTTKTNTIKARFKSKNATAALKNTAITYEIMDVDMEIYQYQLNDGQKSKLNSNMKKGLNLGFMTWSLERVNMPAVAAGQTYQRQFDLEPNCVNVFGMMPKQFSAADAVAQPLFSVNQDFTNYRWRLNTVDTTSQDVVPYQSLYNDRLMATLTNGYLKIKNLRLSAGQGPDASIVSGKASSDVKTFLIPTPIPKSESNQVLQLRMLKNANSADAGNTILHVWKHIQKDMKLRSGGVEVM